MADFLHTMVRITDPEKSRAFYEALGFRFSRDMDTVRAPGLLIRIGRHGGVRVLLIVDADSERT